MLIGALVGAFLAPMLWYLWNEHRRATPSLYWPVLARDLELSYQADPPRIGGRWAGREVSFSAGSPVKVAMRLSPETRLRVECGPKEEVERRAGLVVPDAVAAGAAFSERLLARCSDRAAGTVVFDDSTQHRLAELPRVDFVGQDGELAWSLPDMRDYSEAKAVLTMLETLSETLEGFPKGGTRA